MPRLKVWLRKEPSGAPDGVFTPERRRHHQIPLRLDDHPGPGVTITWGDVAANYWWTAASGRSWGHAERLAIQALAKHIGPDFCAQLED